MIRTTNRSFALLFAQTVAVLCLLVLALGATRAQSHDNKLPSHLAGLINDYGPASVSGGPYEMRGPWTLDIQRWAASADFTVILNMETSDYGMAESTKLDPTKPLPDRGAHTHHIFMHGSITTDTSHCPTYNPATTGPVIVIMGQPKILTGNGSPAPFQVKGPSTLWVCIAGGTDVPYSNIAMTFTDGGATGHFGTQPIHGVVIPTPAQDRESEDHGPAMQ